MKAWYLSEKRFKAAIIKQWEKSGFKYNAGHVNILRFAYRTVLFYENLNGSKVSKANCISTNQSIF